MMMMMMNSKPLAPQLFARGDQLEILQGQLTVTPRSGKPVPEHWLKANRDSLAREILTQLNLDAFVFSSYDTGHYSAKRCAGITLQFESLVSDSRPYCIFNAALDRIKTTKYGKKGSPLPAGQFRVGSKSSFIRFWKTTGLTPPPRLSSFHDYMGNLKKIIFTGRFKQGEKLEKRTVQPLTVSSKAISSAYSLKPPDNIHTQPIQTPDKSQTSTPYNDFHSAQLPQGLASDSTTGDINYGTRHKEARVNGNNTLPINHSNNIEANNDDEWLTAYSERDQVLKQRI